MEKETLIHLSTIVSLIKRQIRMRVNGLYIAFGTVSAVVFLLLIAKLFPSGFYSEEEFLSMVFPSIFIGGLIFTSKIFSELNNQRTSMFYITLPASTLEKLLASWFLTSFLFLGFSIILAYVINIVVSLFSGMFFSTEILIVNLFSLNALKFYAAYLFFNTIFILGAVTFRRNNFLRTVFAMTLFVLIAGTMAIISAGLFFGDMLFSGYFENMTITSESYMMCSHNSTTGSIIHAFIYLILTGFLLTVAFFKLKERQV